MLTGRPLRVLGFWLILLPMSKSLKKGERTMGELTRGERLQIMLTMEELRALDDWRFQRRMPSRAAAIRELLKRGLAVEGIMLAPEGSKSQDFGVVMPKPARRSEARK